jgi:hypothetical protein
MMAGMVFFLDILYLTDQSLALLNAAHEGHVTVVRVLLDSGASIEQPDLMGW